MLFISGTTANNSSAENEGPMQQLRVVLDRITKMVLSEGGYPSDIVRLTTFVTKIDDWFPLEGEIVDIFTEFFGDQKPTNAIMEVSRLATPFLVVEIEATVILD
jgi:enamine deaminase RidA (YjgF/YER057c/UK114 family)